MNELETRGVQQVPAVTLQSGTIGARGASRCVERIADERVPCARQVDADLVRSAGCDVHIEQCRVIPTLDDMRLTVGGLSARHRGVHAAQHGMWNGANFSIDRKRVPRGRPLPSARYRFATAWSRHARASDPAAACVRANSTIPEV